MLHESLLGPWHIECAGLTLSIDARVRVRVRPTPMLKLANDLADRGLPLPVALDRYRHWLTLRDFTERLIVARERVVRRAADQQRWEYLHDITPESVVAYLAACKERGIKASSRNQYRTNLSCFTNWCVEQGLLYTNPVQAAPKARQTKGQARYVPTLEEVGRLIEAARKRKGDRWLAYLIMATCGIRPVTVSRLTWSMVHEAADPPRFDLPAWALKGGERATVWMTRELADYLAVHRGERAPAPDDPVITAALRHERFATDLKAARIEPDHGDRGSFSLYSLRHFASNRAKWEGLTDDERRAQNTHRPGSKLTEKVYTDPRAIELGRKVERFAPLMKNIPATREKTVDKLGIATDTGGGLDDDQVDSGSKTGIVLVPNSTDSGLPPESPDLRAVAVAALASAEAALAAARAAISPGDSHVRDPDR